MHSSDRKPDRSGRHSKIAARLLTAAAVAAVLLGMEFLASICFDTVHFADYYNYDLRRLEKENAHVGMVIAGASQVYHACDPDILAQELDCDNVIDASSAGQVMDGTYYLVRDILDRFDPEYVVVAMSWDRFFPKKLGSLHRGRLLTADHLPWSEGVEYILTCAPPGQWFNLSKLFRFGGSVTSLAQLRQNYEAKKKVASGDWDIDTQSVSYYGKNGYIVYPYGGVQGQMWAEELTFDESRVSAHELEYCRKIAELCTKRGKKLIWMTIPSTLAEIYSIDNYQFCIDYMKDFLEGLGYPYLNFSMLKNREELFPDTSFSDHIHLAEEGSHTFSHIFAETLKKMEAGEDISDMFYATEAEMKQDVHRVVGSFLQVTRRKNGSFRALIRSHQNDDIVPEYCLQVMRDGSWETLVDWQEEKEVEIPGEKLSLGEQVRLEVRQKGEETVEAFWVATAVTREEAGNVEEAFDEAE